MSSTSNRAFDYKGFPLDLSQMILDLSRDDLSDLIEVFRLEGMLPPIAMRYPVSTFHDNSYDRLFSAWSQSSRDISDNQLPLINKLPVSSLNALAYIKIAYFDEKTQNFYYIDSKKYIAEGDIEYTLSTKKAIIESGSPNALLYHIVNAATLLRAEIIYTLHYTKVPDIAFQGWYGMHLPFSDTNNGPLTKGIISLVRKI